MPDIQKTIHGARILEDLGILQTGGSRRHFWGIECPACGDPRKINMTHAKEGKVRCRGCSQVKHGFGRTKLYRIWATMLQRCCNVKTANFHHYGGRGVIVCQDWFDAETFCRWAMANGYGPNLSIDRVDPNGNYEPSNCRWVTQSVQISNKRLDPSRNVSGYRGVHRSGLRWQSTIGVNHKPVYLGTYDTAKEAALAREAYIIENCLEHTLNFSRPA